MSDQKTVAEGVGRSLASGVATLLAAASALPERDSLDGEIAMVEAASKRGYFLPDEEEYLKLRYAQYFNLRVSLLATIDELGELAGRRKVEWETRLPLFATLFAAACTLMRATRFIVDLAAQQPVLWKKLDEEDRVSGIPRKSFTTIYQAVTSPRNQLRFLEAADYFSAHREEIYDLAKEPSMRPVVELLQSEEPFIERRRREAIKRRLGYRWFSFLRRHRSAWKQVMGGMFEVSGRMIADLRQPGLKPRGAPKRIDRSLQNEILELVQPGDVFVTRHDDALSNLFLPGFWPHAALYLGRGEDQHLPPAANRPPNETDAWFVEAKKDGVKLRAASETLALDALVVLRPPLEPHDVLQGLEKALEHCGKPYDFLFDFRTSDRLVCTEVVYRSFHGIGPIRFELREVGGRLCLPAEEFLNQALACGFELVLAAGLDGDRISTGNEARQAFEASRIPV